MIIFGKSLLFIKSFHYLGFKTSGDKILQTIENKKTVQLFYFGKFYAAFFLQKLDYHHSNSRLKN